jgi:hypothetical protein
MVLAPERRADRMRRRSRLPSVGFEQLRWDLISSVGIRSRISGIQCADSNEDPVWSYCCDFTASML